MVPVCVQFTVYRLEPFGSVSKCQEVQNQGGTGWAMLTGGTKLSKGVKISELFSLVQFISAGGAAYWWETEQKPTSY